MLYERRRNRRWKMQFKMKELLPLNPNKITIHVSVNKGKFCKVFLGAKKGRNCKIEDKDE